MPNLTVSPGASQYYSGVFPQTYVLPNIRENPTWVSQWKFDDITSGSGLDSQNLNHLVASGTPTQVAGFRQSSGVQFNGTDSCFYLEWYNGSGIGPLIRTGRDPYPGNPDGVSQAPTQDPHFGFMCSMYVDDFTNDQVILSKWNEVGGDREYMIGISPSGGIFVQCKTTTGTITVAETDVVGGMIPSGQWFDFAFGLHGVDSTSSSSGPGFTVFVNDTIWHSAYGFPLTVEEVNASGIFCIGAADVNGVEPSGFFTGRMEDFRWLNGASVAVSEYNAFVSGVTPLAAYPALNDLNPYLGMHFQMNALPSGNVPHRIEDQYYIEERKSLQHVYASGTQLREASQRLEPGAADGTHGSGIAFIGPTANAGTAFYTRPNGYIPANGGIVPKGSFSIMYWIRPHYAGTQSSTFLGWKQVTTVNGPYNLALGNMVPSITCGFDHNQKPSFEGAKISSGVWTHIAHVVNYEEGIVHTYQSGIWNKSNEFQTSGLWSGKLVAIQAFRMFHQTTNTTAYGLSGILDEIAMFHYPMTSGQIGDIYQSQSGFFVPGSATSETQGIYVGGVDIDIGSGHIGGYLVTGVSASGTIGGYVSGVPYFESGMLGGYIRTGVSASGSQGGYIKSILDTSESLGGWIRASGAAGLFEGGYIRGVETVDETSNFVAFYNIIGRDKDEFDAQVQVAKSLGLDFDAMAVLYREEKKPGTLMINPPIASSGHTGSPVTVNFEARASGLQDKNIFRTFWFFSDDTSTSGSTLTASGTYSTEHTFAESGLFDVLFVAIDDKGLINSSRTLVNTAANATLPQIRLTATPQSGLAPLEVAFSGIIDSAPTEIRDSYVYFGDGTRSASVNSIYKMYPVIGCYIPVFRVRDAEGFIVTDSIVIGANN